MQKKHAEEAKAIILSQVDYLSTNDIFDSKFMPRIITLHTDIEAYYSQLSAHEQEVISQPKNPGSRVRIIIEPSQDEYKRTIVEKIKIYKEKLEESRKLIDKDLKIELESITSQITSDLSDIEHLNNRINAALEILRKLDNERLNHAIYILCEAVVQRGQSQSDSIDAGPNFALNFTNYIMNIAKSYPAIHEIYFLAVIKVKHIYYPMIMNDEAQLIEKRAALKDYSPDGRLAEGDKDKFTGQMDRARAFAFMLGSLFASKESKFNEGDI